MTLTLYSFIKLLHIGTALLSISGFSYRAMIKLRDENRQLPRWLRVFPHLNDTLLLSAAIYLSIASQQLPHTTDWITAKLIALLIYISLGMITLRFAKTSQQRLLAFVAALLSFSYMVAVALSRSPTLTL